MQPKVIQLALTIFVLFFTAYIFLTSSHVRFWADDFCTGSVYNQSGFLAAQRVSWTSWSGRYSYNFFQYLFLMFGSGVTRYAPVVVFILSALSSWFAIYKITGNKHRFFSLVLSMLLAIMVLSITPNIIQSFYWYSGTLIYSLPFVFLQLFFAMLVWRGLVVSKNRRKIALSIALLSLLIAGGFSESFAVAQIVFLTCLLVIVLTVRRLRQTQVASVLVAGVLGLVLALGIMLVAPGTAVRSATLDKPENLHWVISTTFRATKTYFVGLGQVRAYLYVAALVFSVISLLFRHSKFVSKRIFSLRETAWMISVICLGVVLATASLFGVAYYSMAYPPPERALITSSYLIVVGLIMVSILVNLALKPLLTKNILRSTKLLFTLLCLLSTVFLARDMYRRWRFLKNDLATYAYQWDIQEASILSQAATKKKILVKHIPPVGRIDGFKDNKGWVTGCAAGYFGVEEFKVK